MRRWNDFSLMIALVVLLLFGVGLGIVWWHQMQQRMVPRMLQWTPDSLDAVGIAFLQRMQELLAEALRSGVEAAVQVCADTAQRFTEEFARQHGGVVIRRTALRWRNPWNRPDSVETAWMEQFQRWQAEGHSLDTVIVLRRGTELRLLRPIVIRTPLCLMCHGSPEEIAPGVAQIIRQRYPEDQARGFRLGDVRGALSIRVTNGVTP
ncbi:MAG: DUF3365 domain-containing protein [Candidatus Kapabacteria bacterium]|nr:DUF3365 domain-containing protein [Candidatus Kapabacteria bacterium]MDW8224589.1 DUF3365 domain-containing protein [Bacteroidota bacterium]